MKLRGKKAAVAGDKNAGYKSKPLPFQKESSLLNRVTPTVAGIFLQNVTSYKEKKILLI
jgi:hypothetical protein